MESDGDVLAHERCLADDGNRSGKCGRSSATNAVRSVGGWRAGVGDRHVKINKSLGCELKNNTLMSHIIHKGTLEIIYNVNKPFGFGVKLFLLDESLPPVRD